MKERATRIPRSGPSLFDAATCRLAIGSAKRPRKGAVMCGWCPRRFTLLSKEHKLKKILAATAIIAALSTPAFAWEPHFVLLAGQVWNGTSSSFTHPFTNQQLCEAAFNAYQKDGIAKIAFARPKLTGEGIVPVFWHTCSPL